MQELYPAFFLCKKMHLLICYIYFKTIIKNKIRKNKMVIIMETKWIFYI